MPSFVSSNRQSPTCTALDSMDPGRASWGAPVRPHRHGVLLWAWARGLLRSSLPLQRLLDVEMTDLSYRPALRTYCCWVNGAIKGSLVSVLGVTTFSNHYPALHGSSPRALHPNIPLASPTGLPVGEYRPNSCVLWKTRVLLSRGQEGPCGRQDFLRPGNLAGWLSDCPSPGIMGAKK